MQGLLVVNCGGIFINVVNSNTHGRFIWGWGENPS